MQREEEEKERQSKDCYKTAMPLYRLFGAPAKNSATSKALERSQSNRAALSAAVNTAITASIAN